MESLELRNRSSSICSAYYFVLSRIKSFILAKMKLNHIFAIKAILNVVLTYLILMSLTMTIVYTASGEKPLIYQTVAMIQKEILFLRGNNATTLVDSGGQQDCPTETTCITPAIDNCEGSGCTLQSIPSCLVTETFAKTGGKVCEIPVFNNNCSNAADCSNILCPIAKTQLPFSKLMQSEPGYVNVTFELGKIKPQSY